MRVKKVGKYIIDEYETSFPLDGKISVEDWLNKKRKEDRFEESFGSLVDQLRQILKHTKQSADLYEAYWKAGDLISHFLGSDVPTDEGAREKYNRSRSAIYSRLAERLKDIPGTSVWYFSSMVRFREREPDLGKFDRSVTWSLYWEVLNFEDDRLYELYKAKMRDGNLSKGKIRWVQKMLSILTWFKEHPKRSYTVQTISKSVEPTSGGPTEMLVKILEALVQVGALTTTDAKYQYMVESNSVVMRKLTEEIETANVDGIVFKTFSKSGLSEA